MRKKVVVQILTYRTADIEEKLHRFFESLTHVRQPEGGMVLVISDHPSTLGNLHAFLDEKVALLRVHGFRDIELYKSEENRGYSGGHAYAWEHFSKKYDPEYIYLLNEDTALTPDFLVNALSYAQEHPEAGLVQSRIMLGDEREKMNCIGNAMHFLGFGFTIGHRRVYRPAASDEELLGGIPRFYPSGAGLLVRTKALHEVGWLFEPSYFMYHEDLDLAWRMRLRGHEVACARDSVVYHYYEFSRSIGKFYWMERNRLITHMTHLKIATLFVLAPAFIAMEMGTFLFALRSGWWRQKLHAWKFFFTPEAMRLLRNQREKVQKLRLVKDAEILAFATGTLHSEEVKNPVLTYIANPIFSAYFFVVKKIVRW